MLPDLDALLDAAHVVSLPMRVRFRGITTREAVVLQGPYGWGEFSPFVEYDDAEAARWLAAGIEAAWSDHVAALRAAVPVNATVPAVPAADVAAVLERFDGCRTAKVKVAEPGQSLADDVARVGEVRRLLGPSGRVRVDANGAWSVADALRAAQALAPYELEYLEQPCATLDELGELRRALARAGVDVLVAADESIRKADDPLKVAAAGSADVVVVKVAPLGGVRAALDVAEAVRAAGRRVVGARHLGRHRSRRRAGRRAARPALRLRARHGGAVRARRRVVAAAPDRWRAQHGGAREVHPDRLADVLAPPERQEWWRDRLARCHTVLTRTR